MIRPQQAPPEGTDGYRIMNRAGDAEFALAVKDLTARAQSTAALIAEFPLYPNLHLAYGRLLLELHENDDALHQFQEELRRDPQNIHCLLEIAAVRYQVDSKNALPYAEQAVKLAPHIPFAHYLLGACVSTSMMQQAQFQSSKSLAKACRAPRNLFRVGNAYARTGQKLEAAKARAEFARLNALDSRQSPDAVHSEQSSGLNRRNSNRSTARGPPR